MKRAFIDVCRTVEADGFELEFIDKNHRCRYRLAKGEREWLCPSLSDVEWAHENAMKATEDQS